MRLGLYAGASTAAAAACLLKAFHDRPNAYSSLVYLSQSNACLLIITNLLLVMACSFMYGLQRLLYGPLRPIEMEQLSEKAWYAVLDTLLAMPSFREDVGGWLLTMFVLLLAGKVWGWIAEGRVDILEQQPPANPRLFHIRLATSLIVSVAFDLYMLVYCIETVLADPRPGMMVIFTFEFAIQLICSNFTLIRYGLSVMETSIQKRQTVEAIETRKNEIRRERIEARQNETAETADETAAPAPPLDDEPIVVDENEVDVPGWEEKRRYLFVVEVVIDFLKLIIYIIFFTVSIMFNGLPMHIMRDVYMTFASFSKRVTDYVAYRKATSDMNTRYPDATTEEIREDACIVCRETMVAWAQPEPQAPAQQEGEQAPPPPAPPAVPARRDEGLRAKKLPCGHILHLRCLKAWLERQQVCPTCRRPVVSAEADAAAQPGGAPGANPGAPGQPGQQRRNRPHRPRILNLGPVRIGFMNGGQDQLRDAVNQMLDQPPGGANAQPAANQPGVQPGLQPGLPPGLNPQGPNHLGLQVPYIDGPQVAAAMRGTTPAPRLSTQVQLMMIEQRLVQQAHNLNLELQQLETVRRLEAELARLRASHIPNQPSVGTTTAVQQQINMQQPPMTDVISTPEVFRGRASHQRGTGNENLPEGLVLPEGWTVTPLFSTEDPLLGARFVQPRPNGPTTNATNGHSPAPPTGDEPTAQAPQQSAEADTVGPTDENGSPLFAPVPNTSTNGHVPSAEPTAAENSTPNATVVSAHPQLPTQSENESLSIHPRPGDANGWSFDPQETGSSSNAGASTEGAPGYAADERDKSKGKPVEVEEEPDAES